MLCCRSMASSFGVSALGPSSKVRATCAPPVRRMTPSEDEAGADAETDGAAEADADADAEVDAGGLPEAGCAVESLIGWAWAPPAWSPAAEPDWMADPCHDAEGTA